jgi:tryptophan-rich sensory protein
LTGGLRWALTERLMDFLGSKMNSLMTIYTISPAAAVTLVPFALWLEVSVSLNQQDFHLHFFIPREKVLTALSIQRISG